LTENNILDPNITEYQIKSKAFHNAITDRNGIELGKQKFYSLYDNNDSLILKIRNKHFGKRYEVKDSERNLLGIVKKIQNWINSYGKSKR
jgi:hypothetical protein